MPDMYAETASVVIVADIDTTARAEEMWALLGLEAAETDVLVLAGDLSYAGLSRSNFGQQDTWDDFFVLWSDIRC